MKDWFTQPAAEFVTGPTILRHNDKEIVAAATRDGRVILLDAQRSAVRTTRRRFTLSKPSSVPVVP